VASDVVFRRTDDLRSRDVCPPLQDLARDSAYALRAWRRSPAFFSVAALTLALGIGATTAIFSVLNGVVFRPLQYREPDRIVAPGTRWARLARETQRLTAGDLLDLGASRETFDTFSAYWGGEVGVQVAGVGEFARVFWVEPGFFRVFGIDPANGRVFVPPDGEVAAVVGQGFAERVFGGGRQAIGKGVSVEGQAYGIVGVLPRGFDAPRRTEIWLPAPARLQGGSPAERTAFNYYAVARLAPGVSLAQARARVDALAARLEAAHPDSNGGRGFTLDPLGDRIVSPVRATLFVLMGAVGLVLVIACVNVANLLLARATTRSHEIALRAALGASRTRIARQLVAESLMLAGAGGAFGLALAYAGTGALLRVAPGELPRLNEVAVDWRVMAFAGACSIAASLLFGLAPAWHMARTDPIEGLRHAGPRGGLGGRTGRVRNALVVVEVALSFVLATGAGLLLRSYLALNSTELGFRPDSVLIVDAHAPARSLEQYVQTARFFERLSPQLSSIPGVRAVAAVMGLPTGPYGSNGAFEIEGRPTPSARGQAPEAEFSLASPGYFAAIGIPLDRGRDFSDADRHNSPFVAIVSRTLAKRDFPAGDPIGQRIRCGLDAPETWMTVVGVVGDVRQDSPGSAPGAAIYMPLEQHPYHANEVHVVIRADVEPGTLAEPVRRKMRALNPTMAMKFATLDEMVASSIDTPRFRTYLLGVFASLALLLAMAGVYGVMACAAAQRTAEFGVRLALGAGRGRVFAVVLAQAAGLGFAGLSVGIALSLAAGRMVRTMLYGVTPLDTPAYVAAAALLSVAVLAAGMVPAWQATRIDPVLALRTD
jgi:putative ABC transport system permease protein